MATIGIDLGTSNSLVGYWDGDHAKLIPNMFGKLLTPSVVSVDETGEILIGEIAKERLYTHPTCTVAAFKRFMGTDKVYRRKGHTFSPVELSALILRNLKADAEKYLQEECRQAVISVPAYFNNIQREATIEAAKLADLDTLNLISEPTAAAMAYGLHKGEEDSSILVIDLGGGTFDVSLLEMFEGIMQVKAIAGDNHLGGEDFTEYLIRDCIKEQEWKYHTIDASLRALLYRKMEHGKIQLSNHDSLEITFEYEGQSYQYKRSQQQLKELWKPLLNKIRKPVSRVLNDTKMTVREVDQVILIGGATRAPTIRHHVGVLLGKLPFTQINPDEAVGLGAVIQTALKERKEMLDEMILTDVCGYTMGVDYTKEMHHGNLKNGYYAPIIERNTSIPVSKMDTFQTLYDYQEMVRFNIYQGENMMVKDNLKIGEIEVPVPRAPKGLLLNVRFTYDTNGILEVVAKVPDSNEEKRLVIQNSPNKLTDEEIEKKLEKLKLLKIHPADRAENRLLLARAERLYAESLGDMRGRITELILWFQQELEKQDENNTEKAAQKMSSYLEQLEKELEI